MKTGCPICKGVGWVCENCPDQPWSEDIGCLCGAGMRCKCQVRKYQVRKYQGRQGRIEEPDASQVDQRKPPDTE